MLARLRHSSRRHRGWRRRRAVQGDEQPLDNGVGVRVQIYLANCLADGPGAFAGDHRRHNSSIQPLDRPARGNVGDGGNERAQGGQLVVEHADGQTLHRRSLR